MAENGKRFFSGANLGQALLAAADAFGLAPERVAYEQVEGRHTSLKGTRRIVIAVDPASPQRLEVGAPPTITVPSKVALPAQSPPVVARAASDGGRPTDLSDGVARAPRTSNERLVVEAVELLVALSGLELGVVADEREGGSVTAELVGRDRRWALGRHGEVLRAFEQVIPRLVPEELVVDVDCDGFRARHEADLRRLAQEACREVVELGADVLLEPLAPAERRVVHLAVKEHDGLVSESEGEGYLKRVRIALRGVVGDEPAPA